MSGDYNMDNASMSSGGANNSSDFVRKLYKMLEDPSYSSVVRWGDDGDSFVVLENEKFTKSILPKHFKHSNFASFVRQLNKYDFHKVRQSNEDGATSQYGPNAWEFKHPEFKANSKETLDNIRRKAPAPRKPTTLNEEQMPIQQIDLMNQQMVAQAQQIELLAAQNSELRINHQNMVQELMRLHKTVLNHDRVMQDVMTFLHSVDAKQRRDSKILFPGATADPSTTTSLTPTSQNMPVPEDEQPASPLQHASKLLSEYVPDVQLNFPGLDQINSNGSRRGDANSGRYSRGTGSAGSSGSLGYSKLNGADLEQMVYPMGQNNGIDPMYSEHIHNIPYALPPKDVNPRDQFAQSRKKSTFADPGWTRQPRVLLVEDDPTCRQIGGKFLVSFQCVVDTALDGLEAVSKIQEGGKYDMILMDIIMPNLDGVSACHIIRQFDRTPIIAMTSNIRSDDIQMYFQHGMDDVLPKPFTRRSLLEMLEKHLMHLKKLPAGMDPPSTAGLPGANQSSGPHSVRDDMSAGASPAGSSGTWNSPGQYSGISPVNPSMSVQYGNLPNQPQYVDATSPYSHQSPHTPHIQQRGSMNMPQTHRRGQSDIGVADIGANKRQRMNPPFGQQMGAPSMNGRPQ